MNNIIAVTHFMREKLESKGICPDRRILHFHKVVDDDKYYCIDNNNHFWRIYDFVDNSCSYDETDNPCMIYNAGVAFGDFQRLLSDFPIERLTETIPYFHNTVERFSQLEKAIYEDKMGRVESVAKEIEFYRARAEHANHLIDLQNSGFLPTRVTHNDTKCNNVLIDNQTDEAICLIDLDTVMPGLSAFDFGDAIRSCTNTAAEDERDLEKVHFSITNFEAFTKGFIGASGGFFTEHEVDNMVWGARLMTLECGSRFLADYLNGDVYFKTDRSGHNLDRARTHIKLLTEMEEQLSVLEEIVQREAVKAVNIQN